MNKIRTTTVLLILLTIAGCNSDNEKVVSMHAALDNTYTQDSKDHIANLQTEYSKGNWRVYTPVDNPDKSIMIMKVVNGKEVLVAMASKDNVGVFQNNLPVYLALDKDTDGFYDDISLQIYDKKGKLIRTTDDFNHDGFPDTLFDMVNEKPYAYINDNWLRIISKSRKEYVKINKKLIQIVKSNTGWVYANEKFPNKKLNMDSGADAPPPVN